MDGPSPKEKKALEDLASRGGCRNPAALQAVWPELWRTMRPIAEFIRKARRQHPELKNVHKACGKEPSREPPPRHLVEQLRAEVASLLGLRPDQTASLHPNSPWQSGLIREVQKQAATQTRPLRAGSTRGPPWAYQRP